MRCIMINRCLWRETLPHNLSLAAPSNHNMAYIYIKSNFNTQHPRVVPFKVMFSNDPWRFASSVWITFRSVARLSQLIHTMNRFIVYVPGLAFTFWFNNKFKVCILFCDDDDIMPCAWPGFKHRVWWGLGCTLKLTARGLWNIAHLSTP